ERNEADGHTKELVSSAELEMHRVVGLTLPVASPRKSRFTKYCDYCRIHVAGSALLVGLRIKVDGDAPGMGGELGPGALRTKRKTATEAGYFVLRTGDLKTIKDSCENIRKQFMASHCVDGLRMVP